MLLLHQLLELLELLHLEELHGVDSRWKAVGVLRELSDWHLGLRLHHVSSFWCDDAEFLHESDDGEFHVAEDLHDLGVGHDHVIAHVFHEVLLLVAELFVDEVVEGQCQEHWDQLEVFWGALETGEEILEEGNLGLEFIDLVCEDFLCDVERGFLFRDERFSE